MVPDEGHPQRASENGPAGVTGGGPEHRAAEAERGETPADRGAVRRSGWPVPPQWLEPRLWSAYLERGRSALESTGARDGLIWVGLIAVLGLYGWLAAEPPLDAEGPTTGTEHTVDPAVQRAMVEKASLERQIADARGRIATLEETLEAERQQGEAPPQASSDSTAVPGGRPSVLAELGGRTTERGIFLDLSESDLSFPIGSAILPDGELPILDRIADLLVQHPTLSARVEGHTDSAGRDEANLALSQSRADAVKGGLVARGVGAQRIQAVGYGEARPIADNGTRAGRDRNRRIEVYLIGDVD